MPVSATGIGLAPRERFYLRDEAGDVVLAQRGRERAELGGAALDCLGDPVLLAGELFARLVERSGKS
jgi:hypothetical protein